jgi:predicted cobalt transporter CbtA
MTPSRRIRATAPICNVARGFFWGLGAFAVFVVAPGLGLPPELPGIAAAPQLERQIWWTATILSTAAGLGLITFRRSAVTAAVAILLIAAPHLFWCASA